MPKGKKEARKTYPLRLSPKERETLEGKAAEASLKLSEYIRQKSLSDTTLVKKKGVPAINILTYTELGRIGNNINQLTKLAHQSSKRGVQSNLDVTQLENLQELIKKVRRELAGIDKK